MMLELDELRGRLARAFAAYYIDRGLLSVIAADYFPPMKVGELMKRLGVDDPSYREIQRLMGEHQLVKLIDVWVWPSYDIKEDIRELCSELEPCESR